MCHSPVVGRNEGSFVLFFNIFVKSTKNGSESENMITADTMFVCLVCFGLDFFFCGTRIRLHAPNKCTYTFFFVLHDGKKGEEPNGVE